MKLKRLWSISLILSAAWCSSAVAQITPDIARRLTSALTRNHLLGGLSTQCISYSTDENTPEHLDVGVYEIHGGKCPGDVLTHPRMMGLRYDKRTRRIFQELLAD